MKLEKACMLTKKIAEAEDTKLEARTKACYFTRTRKMSFSELVYYILHPGKESTRLGLTRFLGMIGKAGVRMSEQAFSKARSHFSHWPFEKMVRETTAEEYCSEDVRTWNGYYLFAIDGTTLALPDKASLCKDFGGSGRKKDSATASASILYDIENDWIADAAIDPYPTMERTQAMGHILRLKELGIASQNSENKFTYQANMAQLIGTLKDRFIRACLLQNGRRRCHAIQDIIDEISCAVSPLRPNRSSWRNPGPERPNSALTTNLISDLKLLTL